MLRIAWHTVYAVSVGIYLLSKRFADDRNGPMYSVKMTLVRCDLAIVARRPPNAADHDFGNGNGTEIEMETEMRMRRVYGRFTTERRVSEVEQEQLSYYYIK